MFTAWQLSALYNGKLHWRLQDPVIWPGHTGAAENSLERLAFYLTLIHRNLTLVLRQQQLSETINTLLFLSDPSAVNLEKVSNIIVDQSLKDQVFSKEAGRICYTIVQVDTDIKL